MKINEAPDPIDDLSPFIYNMETQNDGLYYYTPKVMTDKYYVAPVTPDGANNSYITDVNPNPSTGGALATTQPDNTSMTTQPSNSSVTAIPSTTPPATTPTPQTGTGTTSSTPNISQIVTNTLDNILGITVVNNNTTNNTSSNSSTQNTDTSNTSLNSTTSNTSDLTNNTANINTGTIGSTPPITPASSMDISSYGKPVLIGGVVGMIVAKLVKKDIFWGFVFGAGSLSLYQYSRTQFLNQ